MLEENFRKAVDEFHQADSVTALIEWMNSNIMIMLSRNFHNEIVNLATFQEFSLHLPPFATYYWDDINGMSGIYVHASIHLDEEIVKKLFKDTGIEFYLPVNRRNSLRGGKYTVFFSDAIFPVLTTMIKLRDGHVPVLTRAVSA